MNLILNVIFAWLSVLLLILLMIIWVLRLGVKRKWFSAKSFFGRMNRQLRVAHNWLGVIFIITALIHGFSSSVKVVSLNWGSLSFLLGIILGVMFLFKRYMNRKVWLNSHRILSVLAVVTLIIHLIDVGGAPATKAMIMQLKANQRSQTENLTVTNSEIEVEEEALVTWANEEQIETEEDLTDGSITYQDGIYTGSAEGFGGVLTVEVTIESELITNIEVISHNEVGSQFYSPAIEQIPNDIMDAQTISVDSVSGSTYTSVGIKNAVADALSQALVSGEIIEEESLPAAGGHRHGQGKER